MFASFFVVRWFGAALLRDVVEVVLVAVLAIAGLRGRRFGSGCGFATVVGSRLVLSLIQNSECGHSGCSSVATPSGTDISMAEEPKNCLVGPTLVLV